MAEHELDALRSSAAASRRAALNLMEDAIQARQAVERLNTELRASQDRLATELAGARRLQSASALLIQGGDARSLYKDVVEAAVAITQSDMGSMHVIDVEEDALRSIASVGFDAAFAEIFGVVQADSASCFGVARRTGRRVIVPDVEQWEAVAGTPALDDLRRTGIRAVQSTSLLARDGRLVGMISTFWRTPHVPHEGELRLFDVLAREAADLIEHRSGQEATARLAAIVASSDDAILGLSLDGTITSWNRGAERLFGYAPDEAIGESVMLLIPPDRRSVEQHILERVRRGESVEHFETVRQRKEGARFDISITVSPVRDAAGRVIGASKIARDITGRKLAEEALREADRRKNQFLATLAHELRGPLAPIRNGLQIVRMRSQDADAIASVAAMMERQVGQMARLIDDLIDVSRISQGKLHLLKEPIELSTAVRSIAETIQANDAPMRHEWTFTFPPDLIYVNVDPTRLAQVVGNLLGNACNPGGRIDVRVVHEGDQGVIRVRDSGIGIDAAHIGEIFELFAQIDDSVERTRGGLGIGLSLVRTVVELHGGTVSAHSEGLGRGSEFAVRLPVMHGSPRAEETPRAAAPTARHRILVVDDNQDSADSMAKILELGGHDVHTAHDGLAAVEEANRFRPELILLDLGLPKLNGYEAARRIRRDPGGKYVKLVAVTGWGQEEDRRRSEEAGFDAHFV